MSHIKTNSPRQAPRLFRPQVGFTLIEVLVTVIILAIGVVGVASLQISTYSQLRSSHNMATASMLAGEMADRMAANSAQVLANNYNHIADLSTPKDCAAAACTAAELAAYDVNQWQTKITRGSNAPGSLPGGRGAVLRSLEPTTPNDFDIIVQWDDDLSGSVLRACDPNDPDLDALDCYTITVRH
jgi:type IV pilus assembly protein PilV